MATGQQQQEFRTPQEYVQALAAADPQTALQIAMAETQRVQALAQQANAEYRAMAEIDFDNEGRIVKANMAGLWRLGQMYARSNLVPEQYRGKPDDCAIACQLAFRWRADPMMVMQSSYIVHGRPGIEGKLLIALLNSSGKIKGRLRFKLEGEGPNRKCTATAVDAESGDEVEAVVTWAMAEAEGWTKDKTSKSGYTQKSKWNTMPDLMFQYRAAAFLVRVHYPEVLMGMRTVDELEDIDGGAAPASNGKKTARTVEDLMEASEAATPVGFKDHTGPMPSDEELLEKEQAEQAQEGTEPEPEQKDETSDDRPWRNEPLPAGILARFETAVNHQQLDKARDDGIQAAQTKAEFDGVHLAHAGRGAELESGRQAKGRKQKNLV